MDKTLQLKIDSFFSKFRKTAYKKGDILISPNENTKYIFYIAQGKVKQYLISKNGNDIILNIFKNPSFFPVSTALYPLQNIYTFEALTDIEAYKAPLHQVLEFLKINPDITLDLLKRVYKGVDGILLRMVYLMSGNAYSRLINELLIQSKRFGKLRNENDSLNISLKITESELSSFTGMTRETISREIKKLKSKNLLTFEKGSILIYNLNKLEDELSEEL